MNVEQGWMDITKLEAFARSKPEATPYRYHDNTGCPLFHFLKSLGEPVTWVGGSSWEDESGENHRIPADVAAVLVGSPRTFGALADRLAAIVKQESGK